MKTNLLKSGLHRSDIDGLRAVAILSVVAYHVGIPRVGGGYVGVDIFFVISGYLITSMISREIDCENFSLVRFYERRVRRILPALAVVLIASLIGGWIFLLPAEFADFSRSLLAAVASCSNILFWRQSGYFDGPSELKPLLHTWSLGVEEQFYVFLPLILILIDRFWKSRRGIWIAGIAFVSFAISAVGVVYYPVGAFFLLSSRAWELMVGSMLAIGMFPAIRGAVCRNLASASGLLMILIAITKYNAFTPFPGVAALLPCVGAVMVIAAGQSGSSMVSRILSLPLVAFVGLISYSLYLWHWPILVLARMQVVSWVPLGRPYSRTILLLEMFIMAILSWRFVEKPFRSGPHAPLRRPLFITGGVTYSALAVFALMVIVTRGVQGRFSPEAVRIASFEADGGDRVAEREGTCMVGRSNSASIHVKDCLSEDANRPNFLLFGDSHAAHLWYGLSREFPELNIMQATAGTCKPLIQVAMAEPYCQNLRDMIFAKYLSSHHVDGVILSAAWIPSDLTPLAATLDLFQSLGVKVYLVGPNPGYDESLPRLLAQSVMKGDASIPERHLVHTAWTLDESMLRLSEQKRLAGYISLVTAMCPNGKCIEYAGRLVPIESDGNHLTADGSVVIARNIRKVHGLP
jgi:peptidoglycan/LPS O-acetylase OafA/YrhL